MSRLFFNHRFFSLLLLSFLLLGGAAAKASVNYPFKPSSLLSSGHWVKVGVEETGIYEISYDELRQMGFEDPSKVGVFGKGGTAMPISFTNGSDPLITDDLEAVGTWHHDNKIFFYGRGVEEIQFNRYSSQFEKKSRNIYILEGSYFLSDSPEAVFISPEEMPTGKITNFHLGFDYLYHELDLFQNTTHTGQLFWGEDLIGTEGYRKKFHLPLIDTNTKAQLDCRVYAADKSSGSLRYGVTEATGGNRVFNVKHPSPTSGENPNPDFAHMATPVLSLSLPSDEIEVYAEVSDAAGDFINLDYWILTYSKNIPDFSLSDNAQERFTILKKNAKAGVFYVPAEQNVAVFDISEPSRMCLLPEDKGTAKSSFYFHPTEAFHDFIFCNLDKKQLSI
ncbi:MAG: hypothetical protein K2H76_07015, partial [Muribaculaceae bacterium]|nr:hypothetical protein [Muribaculaceae bacterium]